MTVGVNEPNRASAAVAGLAAMATSRLDAFGSPNKEAEEFYDGKRRVRNYGTSIPPRLQSLRTVVGWPAKVVDALEERLDLEAWLAPGDDDLGDVLERAFRDNMLDVEAPSVHLDALIYGVGYVVVGAGAEGEPDVLVTVESPKDMYGEFDARTRRLAWAYRRLRDAEGNVDGYVLYLPNETVTVDRDGVVVALDEHGLGRVPVVQFTNRPRAGRVGGRSEITEAIKSLTESAVRTLAGMEVHREFYQAPQRYVLGASEDDFVDEDGNDVSGWETIMGRVLALSANEQGDKPTVGQFPSASPTPYLEQVRGLSQMVASEGSLPASYFGFVTDNPSSADAIRQAEASLVKRAERRQRTFGKSWIEVARLVVLISLGEVPESFRDVRPNWRDASTPTRAAAADEVVKAIAAGILSAESEVVLDRMGFSETDKARIAVERTRANARSNLAALAQLTAVQPPADPVAEAGE